MRCKGKVVNRACTVCQQTFGNDVEGEHLAYFAEDKPDEIGTADSAVDISEPRK